MPEDGCRGFSALLSKAYICRDPSNLRQGTFKAEFQVKTQVAWPADKRLYSVLCVISREYLSPESWQSTTTTEYGPAVEVALSVMTSQMTVNGESLNLLILC